MSVESVIPSNHLILCCPLLLLPSIFPSIRVFSHESVLRVRWPKYWSFSFNIRPSNENPGLSPSFQFSSVQFSSVAQSCPTLCDPMYCSTPGFLSFAVSWTLLKFMSVELVMPSNHLILCCPLLLPSIFLSVRVFSMSQFFASGGQILELQLQHQSF